MTDPTSTPQPYSTPAAPAYNGGPTNTLAILALIGAFVFPLAGIVMGHIALGQIKRTGEAGHGLALAGTVLGYIFTVGYIIGVFLLVLVPLLFLGAASTIPTS